MNATTIRRGYVLRQTKPGIVTVTTPRGTKACVLAELRNDREEIDEIIRAAGETRRRQV